MDTTYIMDKTGLERGEHTGMLAGLGILAVLAAVIAAIYGIIRAIRGAAHRKKQKQSVVVVENRPGHMRYGRDEAIRIFWQKYRALYQMLEIPEDAIAVWKCSCVFSLEHVRLPHYFWKRDEKLYFFPVWEDIAIRLADPACLHVFTARDRDILFAWTIDCNLLDWYEINPVTGDTTVYFRDREGKLYRTLFLDGGADVFTWLFPDLDITSIMRKRYLGSSKNILDIKGELESLWGQRDRNEITEEDYEEKRRQILRRY